jgi:dolichol-phosphate mannosyltransferase
MQHPPSLITEMIRLWNAGNVDVVEAFKRIRGKESFIYKACSKFLYFILNRMAAMDLDNTSDFCLMDSKVVAAWRQLRETNLFFRGLSAWLGFRRVQLFFDVPARVNGSSRWTVLRLVRLATTSITAFTSLPLHVITLMGGIFFVFALVMGTRAVFLKFYSNTVIDGITTLILLNLLVGSLLMIALGVIGEYIARIYSEVKFRPRYIIADQFVERKSECFGQSNFGR